MNRESERLQDRIRELTDDQLLAMVTVEAAEYRPEAIEFAKSELTKRGIDFTNTAEETETSSESAPVEVDPLTLKRVASGSQCPGCGGQLRSGTLVAEKELTIVFSDTHEERFVRVAACIQCGQLSLAADFETDVG